jgi:hypothetical protein
MAENKDRKGIYVRIGYPHSEVLLLEGHNVIDKAYQEAAQTGDSIAEVLLIDDCVINLHNLMFDEHGVFMGRKVLRSITVKEAIQYLGRHLLICRFLTTQEEAGQFIKLLEEGVDAEENRVAGEIHRLIPMLPERIPHLVPKPKMPIGTGALVGTH